MLLFAGTCLWATGGLHSGKLPVIVSNAVTAVLAGTILFLKLSAKPTAEPAGERNAR